MRKNLDNRGQASVEGVLLMSLMFIIVVAVSNMARNQGWLQQIVQSPWSKLSGMIENGVWVDSKSAKEFHPSINASRHLSILDNGPD